MSFSHALASDWPMDAVDLTDFRVGMRAWASGVTVLTTCAGDTRGGLTATAMCSLSAEPPRLLACVNQRGPTFALMRQAGHLSVNVLAEGQADIAACFAGMNAVADRFTVGAWRPGGYKGDPVLGDALCTFECAIAEIVDAVSHGLIIADIKAVHVTASARPLLYADGRFSKLEDDFFDPRHGYYF
ncbi:MULTISPECIES: flavin reductase family protein [unclassified Beijerinckia]|uniref:flavin reductase family protein n=1 Tax=unclassified Beijerinckia TaxID=2638183 RepID=UPI00089AF907|nr:MULTISPECIES: flavin reductase family protein [unclassified Beijerinckia]MDH7799364.1 flavin reductase (DIM6/NTAB) family NADH-FMN oxidoreductase RutF [Beijerinckia sp. GAS462]SED47718.1 flavin reductase (NADH)/flavin reductase [Beijerinckia sp. 28-YEA-48]